MKTTMQRFMEKICQSGKSECWEWAAAKYTNGYGAFRDGTGKQTTAHRIAYTLFVGEVPENMIVCHGCDNPGCVNPSHLFIGSHQDNTNDKISKGRMATGSRLNHRSQAGEKNHNSKITQDQVIEIRQLYRCGVSQADISRKLNVPRPNVWAIVHRKSWKHI